MTLGFGSVMRKMRLKAGLSQEDLAYRLNITQSTVSKLENERKIPDIYTVINWAEATCAKEMLVAFLYGVDVAAVAQTLQSLLQVVGAFIFF